MAVAESSGRSGSSKEDLYIFSFSCAAGQPSPAVLITDPITWWLLAINLLEAEETDSSFSSHPHPARLYPSQL